MIASARFSTLPSGREIKFTLLICKWKTPARGCSFTLAHKHKAESLSCTSTLHQYINLILLFYIVPSRQRTYTHTHVGLQCQSMLFSSPPTLHLFLELYRSHSSVFNAFLVDGQKMPLGLSSYYFFARSLVRSLAFCLSPSISSCYKKDNFFYIFVAFPCCLSQTPVFFFTRWRLKGRELKINTLPNELEEREESELESEPLLSVYVCVYMWVTLGWRWRLSHVFFVSVCSFLFSAWRTAFSLSQPPALFQTCTKKRHPPQSHPSWRRRRRGSMKIKKKKKTIQ